MEFGLFMMPLHPCGGLMPTLRPDMELIVLADRLGYHEAWIGEHITEMWENAPVPELLIAQALALTENIVLATGRGGGGQHGKDAGPERASRGPGGVRRGDSRVGPGGDAGGAGAEATRVISLSPVLA